MKFPRYTPFVVSTLAMGALLIGCVDRPFPEEPSAPEDIQKQYDSGKINRYEYEAMMRQIKPGWKPPTGKGNTTSGGNDTSGNLTTPPGQPAPYQYSYPSNSM
jgi:hypothetical protein